MGIPQNKLFFLPLFQTSPLLHLFQMHFGKQSINVNFNLLVHNVQLTGPQKGAKDGNYFLVIKRGDQTFVTDKVSTQRCGFSQDFCEFSKKLDFRTKMYQDKTGRFTTPKWVEVTLKQAGSRLHRDVVIGKVLIDLAQAVNSGNSDCADLPMKRGKGILQSEFETNAMVRLSVAHSF